MGTSEQLGKEIISRFSTCIDVPINLMDPIGRTVDELNQQYSWPPLYLTGYLPDIPS
ncbi:hypothetical protein [Halobacillus naozhouensis]|uniref:Uncharacterized protein n=1 Tax=Halobacillus naozhouensis TaxID=554880 RepID=A0ABY8J2E7_9BACI|nr:hypothetical protein [Halobacillus naozhouensis]WFT75747.1 hypothetical protein P9989_05010 [Halobacillus naozhouensis]